MWLTRFPSLGGVDTRRRSDNHKIPPVTNYRHPTNHLMGFPRARTQTSLTHRCSCGDPSQNMHLIVRRLARLQVPIESGSYIMWGEPLRRKRWLRIYPRPKTRNTHHVRLLLDLPDRESVFECIFPLLPHAIARRVQRIPPCSFRGRVINRERIDRLVRWPYPVQYACISRSVPPIVGWVIERAESEVFQGYRLGKC